MATTKVETETKVIVTGITLTLTLREAIAIMAVTQNIAGSPDNSMRKYTDSVGNALRAVGVRAYSRDLNMEDSILCETISEAEIEAIEATIKPVQTLQDIVLTTPLYRENRISAIKELREKAMNAGLPYGLKESKEEIDRRIELHNIW